MSAPPMKARSRVKSDQDVREVLTLLGSVMKGMKRHGGKPGNESASSAFESGALGDRHVAPLLALAMEGPMSVTQLSERIGLTLGTTSMLVGELSRQDLTERREDEDDRRRTIVSLTPELQAEVGPWIQESLEPIRRGLDRMTADQRRGFLEGLRILGEETGDPGSEPC